MTRFEYIEALRKALEGLPPEVIARTVAEYEKRIFDASAAGQSEDEILAGLEEPQQVADRLRAPPAPKLPVVATVAAAQPRSAPASQAPASVLRAVFSFLGLMVFNLFLIVPAIAYAGILIAAFAISLACYVGGIAMTGASVAGVNQISLAEPFHHVYVDKPEAIVDSRSRDGRTVVNIGESGIHVETGDKLIHVVPQATPGDAVAVANAGAGSASASASASAAAAASASGSSSVSVSASDGHSTTVDIGPGGIIVKDGVPDDAKAENDDEDVDIDMPGLHIHNRDIDVDHNTVSLGSDFISESRPVQIGVGLAVTLAGILGFLLCLVVARYTLLGIVRLAQLEFGMLRGA